MSSKTLVDIINNVSVPIKPCPKPEYREPRIACIHFYPLRSTCNLFNSNIAHFWPSIVTRWAFAVYFLEGCSFDLELLYRRPLPCPPRSSTPILKNNQVFPHTLQVVVVFLG